MKARQKTAILIGTKEMATELSTTFGINVIALEPMKAQKEYSDYELWQMEAGIIAKPGNREIILEKKSIEEIQHEMITIIQKSDIQYIWAIPGSLNKGSLKSLRKVAKSANFNIDTDFALGNKKDNRYQKVVSVIKQLFYTDSNAVLA